MKVIENPKAALSLLNNIQKSMKTTSESKLREYYLKNEVGGKRQSYYDIKIKKNKVEGADCISLPECEIKTYQKSTLKDGSVHLTPKTTIAEFDKCHLFFEKEERYSILENGKKDLIFGLFNKDDKSEILLSVLVPNRKLSNGKYLGETFRKNLKDGILNKKENYLGKIINHIQPGRDSFKVKLEDFLNDPDCVVLQRSNRCTGIFDSSNQNDNHICFKD